jgi:poly-gamma-glutamate synthesis protein (capsule biosynthesis protein)
MPQKYQVKIAAVGDCFITRTLPHSFIKQTRIAQLMKSAQIRVGNLETTILSDTKYPAAESGGSWAYAKPDVLTCLRAFGINMLGWANNHTLDYSHRGVISTRKHLDTANFPHAGAGRNLAEASSPVYFETPQARVALLAATTTAPAYGIAGAGRPDSEGRPGVNLLRYQDLYQVPQQELDLLKDMARDLEMNLFHEMGIESGFKNPNPEGVNQFGPLKFISGDVREKKTFLDENDQARLLMSIEEAKYCSDYVLINLHSHEMQGSLECPAPFLEELSRACIDHGADAVIGHGPHVLRGIEIYQDRPIFYSLGNFIYQPDTAETQPQELYTRLDLTPDDNPAQAFKKLSQNHTRGHYTQKKMWSTVLPVWEFKGGKLGNIYLYPVESGFGKPFYRMGWPKLTQNTAIIRALASLSEPYGTEIQIEQDHGVISPG